MANVDGVKKVNKEDVKKSRKIVLEAISSFDDEKKAETEDKKAKKGFSLDGIIPLKKTGKKPSGGKPEYKNAPKEPARPKIVKPMSDIKPPAAPEAALPKESKKEIKKVSAEKRGKWLDDMKGMIDESPKDSREESPKKDEGYKIKGPSFKYLSPNAKAPGKKDKKPLEPKKADKQEKENIRDILRENKDKPAENKNSSDFETDLTPGLARKMHSKEEGNKRFKFSLPEFFRMFSKEEKSKIDLLKIEKEKAKKESEKKKTKEKSKREAAMLKDLKERSAKEEKEREKEAEKKAKEEKEREKERGKEELKQKKQEEKKLKQEKKRQKTEERKQNLKKIRESVLVYLQGLGSVFKEFFKKLPRILFAFFILILFFYSLFAILLLKFDIDNGFTRFIASYAVVPAIINDDGVIGYYDYKDIKSRYTEETAEYKPEEFKVYLVDQMLIRNLSRKYGMDMNGLSREKSMEKLQQNLVFDREINQVGLSRILKIKEMIDAGGNFGEIAGKYGDSQGHITINKDGENFFAGLKTDFFSMEAGDLSRIEYAKDGYYIFNCYNKDDKSVNLSYVFVSAKTYNQYLAELIDNFKMWSFVE